MKNIFTLLCLSITGLTCYAQVGIGTTSPAATLDVVAEAATLTEADGIIAPRVSRAELTAKSAAYGTDQQGAIIYINDIAGATNAATAVITTTGYYYYSGTAWQSFTTAAAQSKWSNNTTDNRVELTNLSNGTTGRGVINAFHIEDGGNVGIGVVDPDQKLSVGGTVNTGGNLELNQLGTGNRNAIIDLHASDTGNADFKSRIIRNAGDDGAFSITNRGTGDIIIDVLEVGAGGPSLSINGTSGFVGFNKPLGIGPTQQLDVNGNGLFQNNLFISGVPADGERGLRIHKDASNTAFFDVNSNITPLVGTSTAFHWRGNNTNGTTTLMTLAYNGNLQNQGGLSTGGNLELFQQGTGDRAAFIDFHSSITPGDNNARIIKNVGQNGVLAINNSGTGDLRLDVQNAGQAGISLAIDGDDGFVGINRLNPAERLDVDGNGLFSGTVTSSAGLLTSDARLKKDIVTIENSIATLQQLNPVFYSKKQSIDSNDYSRKEYGFIAQELQKVLPELVVQTTREDKVLAVDYNSLIPILTKAIQEQQIQLDSKNNETEVLKSKVTALEAEIAAIKKALKL